MQFKLTELYNTRYFYVTYCTDLTYLFSTFLKLQKDKTAPYNIGNELLGQVYDAAKSGAPVQFDLANCKLTPDVIPIIRRYAAEGLEFIDTKDSWRNEILATNRQRRSIDVAQFPDLPKYDPSMKVLDYIEALDKNITYRTPTNDANIFIPLLYMILVARPSIKVNIGAHCNDFFTFVGSRLSFSDIEHYDEFYLTTPEGTSIVNFSNGSIYVQNIGLADKEKALTVGTLVPTVFGKEKLLQVDCWRSIFKDCLNQLNGYRATRKQTLEEILT